MPRTRFAIPWTHVALYAALLAGGTVLLQWLDYQRLVRSNASAVYDALLATGFLALGVWLGVRLLARRPAPGGLPGEPGQGNPRAVAALGISQRELEVLQQIAAGHSNKEIAARLHVSPNTVKTHVARLLEKLEARRRTDALRRARELGLVP